MCCLIVQRQLHATQIATFVANDENALGQSALTVDSELDELDKELHTRQATLRDLTQEAHRLGIKLKPGVWV